MSYDGFVTHSVVHELNGKILGGKIDKIYQPESDEIIISVRTLMGITVYYYQPAHQMPECI